MLVLLKACFPIFGEKLLISGKWRAARRFNCQALSFTNACEITLSPLYRQRNAPLVDPIIVPINVIEKILKGI